ncbi:MAG: FAD-dependent oxidoreductase [Candidatus Omnitrophota bacterium]
MQKNNIPALPAQKRIKSFAEVSLGFNKKQALDEAMHCPQPSDPAHVHRCPLGVDVLGFIRFIREGKMREALLKIRERNHFPGVCGRVCSAPCQKNIYEGETWVTDIRALERFAFDFGDKKEHKAQSPKQTEQKIAIIGSGPAGLTAAADLAQLGYGVVIFEAMHKAGGALWYGIPEFRLPKKVLNSEIDYVKSLGVEIKLNAVINQNYSVEQLLSEGYEAVLLASGSGSPKISGLRGEHFKGVYLAEEYLMRSNSRSASLSFKGKKAVVIGVGNVAFDCARTSVRLGCDTTLVCEGTEDDLMMAKAEIEFAKEEGVKLEVLTKPLEILSHENHCTRGVRFIKLDFADPGSSGEWKLTPVQGSEFVLDADIVIIAAGHKPNCLAARSTEDLKVNKDGSIWTKKNSFATSVEKVFATGAVAQPGNLIMSMVLAKRATQEIDSYLKEKLSAK